MKTTKKFFVILTLVLSVIVCNQCTKKVYDTTGSINGIVNDLTSGEPIGGVSISLSPSGKTIATGSDGSFEFTELEPQLYKIQAMHANYKTNTKTVNVIAGETVRGDIQLTLK